MHRTRQSLDLDNLQTVAGQQLGQPGCREIALVFPVVHGVGQIHSTAGERVERQQNAADRKCGIGGLEDKRSVRTELRGDLSNDRRGHVEMLDDLPLRHRRQRAIQSMFIEVHTGKDRESSLRRARNDVDVDIDVTAEGSDSPPGGKLDEVAESAADVEEAVEIPYQTFGRAVSCPALGPSLPAKQPGRSDPARGRSPSVGPGDADPAFG